MRKPRRFHLRRAGILNPYLYHAQVGDILTWASSRLYAKPMTRHQARKALRRFPFCEIVPA